MIELKKMGSWEPYLPELFFSHLGLRIENYEIDAIETGRMNFVFRVRTDKGIFFLKQALSKAKAGSALGTELHSISSQRLEYEKKCIAEISAILPDGTKIPTVHHYDPASHILILSDVSGNGGKLLESVLLEGLFDVSTASAVGQFLGVMHRRTWGVQNYIRGCHRNDRNNWVRFLNMRTKGISGERISPEILKALEHLYKQSHRHHSHDVLIWMDCCPKNVIVRNDRKIGVLDFEIASWIGDPAYDLGFFIGHYLIHAMQKNAPVKALQAIAGSIQAYRNEDDGMIFRGGMMTRVLKFAAATILYRMAGASRLNYIEPQSVQQFIQKAGVLLRLDFEGGPDQAISMIREALA
jgi:5-methylthioribose kinase